mmetsp:Transcript_8635/g.35983  ORF Transcript_8635/g.35983 Transcript_8635/m.35983 type:complete len:233 (-) Transcript_8635:491-1189(-)
MLCLGAVVDLESVGERTKDLEEAHDVLPGVVRAVVAGDAEVGALLHLVHGVVAAQRHDVASVAVDGRREGNHLVVVHVVEGGVDAANVEVAHREHQCAVASLPVKVVDHLLHVSLVRAVDVEDDVVVVRRPREEPVHRHDVLARRRVGHLVADAHSHVCPTRQSPDVHKMHRHLPVLVLGRDDAVGLGQLECCRAVSFGTNGGQYLAVLVIKQDVVVVDHFQGYLVVVVLPD